MACAKYVVRIVSFIDCVNHWLLIIVIDPENDVAGRTVDAIIDRLPVLHEPMEFTHVHYEPNGTLSN